MDIDKAGYAFGILIHYVHEEYTMTAVYNTNAKKRPTNISVNSDLLQKVKEYKINISSTVKSILEDLVKQKEIEKWKESNREAIKDYNDYIDKNGLFGDDFRSF